MSTEEAFGLMVNILQSLTPAQLEGVLSAVQALKPQKEDDADVRAIVGDHLGKPVALPLGPAAKVRVEGAPMVHTAGGLNADEREALRAANPHGATAQVAMERLLAEQDRQWREERRRSGA